MKGKTILRKWSVSRALDVVCPKCQKNNVVKAHKHDEIEQQLRTYFGCKSCQFRWLMGRKFTNVEKCRQFGFLNLDKAKTKKN